MKILHFLVDEQIDYAQYRAGETPAQWFSDEQAAGLVERGVAIVVVEGPHTPSWEAWVNDPDAATTAALSAATDPKKATTGPATDHDGEE